MKKYKVKEKQYYKRKQIQISDSHSLNEPFGEGEAVYS